MNNKVIIAVIAIIVILAGAFLLTRKADSPTTVDSNTETATQASAEASIQKSSLKGLIQSGQNQKCTFKSDEANGKSEGVFYAGGGKSRGDFKVEVNGTKTESHMIFDGTNSYMWSDGQSAGIKMALDVNAQSSATAPANNVDPNKNYEFNCEKWDIENSKFELPSGINFVDTASFSAGAEAAAGMNANTDNKAMQQAACNNLPEPAKTQCLSAIP